MTAPASLYCDLDQLLAWFAGAKPAGSWVRFASGPALDPAHPVVRQVAEWEACGAVERMDVDAGFHVRRRDPGTYALAAQEPAEDRRAAALLALLAKRAKAGDRQAPSYRMIAQELGLRDRFVARRLFEGLVQRGAIAVSGDGPGRVVRLIRSDSS